MSQQLWMQKDFKLHFYSQNLKEGENKKNETVKKPLSTENQQEEC